MENDLLPTNASNFQNRSNFTEEIVLVKEKKDSFTYFNPGFHLITWPLSFNFNFNSRKTLRSTVSKKFLFKRWVWAFSCRHACSSAHKRWMGEGIRSAGTDHGELLCPLQEYLISYILSHLCSSGITFWNAILVSWYLVHKSQCFKISEYLNEARYSGTEGRSNMSSGQPGLHSESQASQSYLVRFWLKIKQP